MCVVDLTIILLDPNECFSHNIETSENGNTATLCYVITIPPFSILCCPISLRMHCRRVSSSTGKSDSLGGGGASPGPRPSSGKTADAQVTGTGRKTGPGLGSGGRSFNIEREVSYMIVVFLQFECDVLVHNCPKFMTTCTCSCS